MGKILEKCKAVQHSIIDKISRIIGGPVHTKEATEATFK